MTAVWLVLAGTQPTGFAVPLDLTGLGVAGVTLAIVLRAWWYERQDRIATQAALLELTQSSVAATTEVAGSLRSVTDAVDRLTDEIRRGGRS